MVERLGNWSEITRFPLNLPVQTLTGPCVHTVPGIVAITIGRLGNGLDNDRQ